MPLIGRWPGLKPEAEGMGIRVLLSALNGSRRDSLRNDTVAANQLKRWKSHCEAVPRIYGGVALDFCSLHAEPRSSIKSDKWGHAGLSLVLLDMAASGILDTILLPYTIFAQDRRGSIEAARF